MAEYALAIPPYGLRMGQASPQVRSCLCDCGESADDQPEDEYRSALHPAPDCSARHCSVSNSMIYPFSAAFRSLVACRLAAFKRTPALETNGLKRAAVALTLVQSDDASDETAFVLTR